MLHSHIIAGVGQLGVRCGQAGQVVAHVAARRGMAAADKRVGQLRHLGELRPDSDRLLAEQFVCRALSATLNRATKRRLCSPGQAGNGVLCNELTDFAPTRIDEKGEPGCLGMTHEISRANGNPSLTMVFLWSAAKSPKGRQKSLRFLLRDARLTLEQV